MADSLAELEDALGLPITPTVTPTVTPIATPAPKLSWWERMQQLADTPPTSISGLTPEEYAQNWTPKGIVENLRVIPEEGASIVGSIVGGTAGTVLGGPVGGILGGALGSYADVPIQSGLDYLLGATPTQSRVSQATQEAAIGAGLETALKATSPIARYGVGALTRLIGPETVQGAQALVGEELSKLVTRRELNRAAVEKATGAEIGLPITQMTTAQLTRVDKLAQAEQLLKTQPLGDANITFFNQAKNQIDEINQTATSLTNLGDPNPKRAGEAAKTLLTKARENEFNSAGAKFTDEVRTISAPVKGIADEVKAVEKQIFKDSEVLGPSGEIQGLINQIQDLEKAAPLPKASAGFGREAPKVKPAPTQTTVGTLQDLRSKALEIARDATEGSRDELVADRLVELLGKRLDNIEGTQSLKEARTAWRQAKQTWYKDETGQMAPLARLLRKQSPEDIITDVSKKSATSDAYQKAVDRIVGGLEPNKLASEMADFANQTTIDDKLNWIRNKRAIYIDSPIWETMRAWEDILKRIKSSGEAGSVPALAVKNIGFQAKALVRALGGADRVVAASPEEAAALSAGANIMRSSVTGRLGSTASGIGAAFASKLGISTATERADQVASILAEALKDPATALQYVNNAAKYGKDAAVKIAIADSGLVSGAELVSRLSPQTGAIARAAISDNRLQTPVATPTPTMTQAEVAQPDALSELEAALGEVPMSEPTPTPEPESVKVGKQNISIPVGKQYTEPRLVKAVMQIESAGNPDAVSPKGAGGLMQLMPGTAKELGVKDVFDPKQNVEGGSKYLKRLENQLGDRKLALAAYNWGIGNVKKAIVELEEKGKEPTWANMMKMAPRETQDYVRKVLLKYNLIEA